MNPSSWAGVITAIATVVTAIGGLVLAVAVLIPSLRASRAAMTKVDIATAKVDEVHTIVNQQRTDAQRYQATLIKALRAAGVEVPDDQSILSDAPPPKN